MRAMRPSFASLKSWASSFFQGVPESETGAPLRFPWGQVPLSQAFSTARCLNYLQWALQKWDDGEERYLLELLCLIRRRRSFQRLRTKSLRSSETGNSSTSPQVSSLEEFRITKEMILNRQPMEARKWP